MGNQARYRRVDKRRYKPRLKHGIALANALTLHQRKRVLHERILANRIEPQKAALQAVIDVVACVGDFIGIIDHDCLKARVQSEPEVCVEIGGELGTEKVLAIGRGMFQDSLQSRKREIQAIEIFITFFELLHHAKRLEVVVKPRATTTALQYRIELIATRVPKGRMPQIMRERNGFAKRLAKPELLGDRTRNLADFERMREARAEKVAHAVEKNLRFVLEPPKRGTMDNPIAVARKRVAKVLFCGIESPLWLPRFLPFLLHAFLENGIKFAF